MRKPAKFAVGLLAILMAGGCYGPFTLTRTVHNWNGNVSQDRWAVELVFLGCLFIPVYSVATLADAIFFNSVEFWTGNNILESNS